MSLDIFLTRSNPKIAYNLILQHIATLKDMNFQGQILASDISEHLQIPYKTVKDVFNQLKDENILQLSEKDFI